MAPSVSHCIEKIRGSWGSRKGILNPAYDEYNLDETVKQGNIHDVDIMTEVEIKDEKRMILKNIILISIAFLFNFNGFKGLSRLQSSLHREEGMGTTTSAIMYAAVIPSSLFLPKLVINFLGYKWTMPVAFVGYITWMAVNGYAVWGTMVPASLLVGICAAPLWTAQKSYFRIAAGRYAELTKKDGDSMVAIFVGFFYCLYQISNITGAIVSSTVLQQNVQEIDDEVLESCGVNDCPGNNASNPHAEDPPESMVWLMLGIYIGIAVLGAAILIIFVDELPAYLKPKKKENIGKDSLKLLASTGSHLKFPKQLALIPLTMYTGFEQATFNAEFTNSFVTCSMGIWQVGYVTIPFGIMNALASLASGQIAKYTGRMPLFTVAFIVDYIVQVWTMLIIYVAIAVVGLLIFIVFVDELPRWLLPKEGNLRREVVKFLTGTARQMKNKKQLALIPITVYTGLEQGALGAEFTKSYVTCSIGIWQIGYVMIPYGIIHGFMSFALGYIVKHTGRKALFTVGFALDFIIQMTMIFWRPNPEEGYVLYIIVIFWAVTDSIWQNQIPSMYAVTFKDITSAFATHGLWSALGWVVAFGYSSYLCTSVKLYILISWLFISALGYAAAEILCSRDNKINYGQMH